MGLHKNIIQNDWWTDNDEYWNLDRFSSDYNNIADGHDMSEGPAFAKRNYIVDIKNPDEAIVQIVKMRETIDIGKETLELMRKTTETLRIAWRGSDAKVHITNLFIIESYIGQFTSVLYEVSKSMYNQLKDFSQRTETNQGNPYNLGSFQEIDFGDLFIMHASIKETLEIFVDTNLASLELDNLKKAREKFQEFTNRFFDLYSYVLDVWQSGGKRDQFEAGIFKYRTKYNELLDWFEQAIKNLSQAIINWEE